MTNRPINAKELRNLLDADFDAIKTNVEAEQRRRHAAELDKTTLFWWKLETRQHKTVATSRIMHFRDHPREITFTVCYDHDDVPGGTAYWFVITHHATGTEVFRRRVSEMHCMDNPKVPKGDTIAIMPFTVSKTDLKNWGYDGGIGGL